MEKIWLKSYPPGVPHDIQPEQYRSVSHMLEESFKKNAQRPFSVCMDRWMSYGELDSLSSSLGAWLQSVRTGADGGSPLSAASAARSLAAVRGLHSFLDAERVSTTGDPATCSPEDVCRYL